MRHISRNIILSFGIAVPAISSPALLSSCSTVWGYNNPIQFGSTMADGEDNPYVNFQGQTFYDNNGNNIVNYLQSNYSIDARTSTYYGYSSPVTKWLYDKDSTEAKAAESQVMPVEKWEHNNLGWKTSSSTEFSTNASFTGTLKNDKYVTVVNNENSIQAANIAFSGNIASAIAAYFSGALKYQASQINKSDDTALNIAWGNGAKFDAAPIYTFDKGQKIDSPSTQQEIYKNLVNKIYYEYVFSQANAHVSHKNHGAFLRGTSANFAYDKFPIPSYNYNGKTKVDISEATKKLLMGDNATADTKFCQAGLTGSTVPAYFSAKSDGDLTITIGDKTDKTPVNAKLKYTDYTFTNVPLIVTATNYTQRWINPTKNNSFHVKDFYIEDVSTVRSAVGKFQNIGNFSNHKGDVNIKEYKFDTTPNVGNTKLQAKVLGSDISSTVKNKVDTRIVPASGDKIDGNKFIVLTTYVVREYDNDSFLYQKDQGGSLVPTEYLTNLIKTWQSVDGHSTWGETEVVAWLRQRNLVSLSSSTNIFPAYFMNIYNDLFKQAYVNAKDQTIVEHGYILDADKVAKHTNALLGIYNRTTTEGYKPSATDLTDDSKNLLSFLTFMFGSNEAKTIDFLNDILWVTQYQE